jgi:hypothetical protein
VKAARREEVSNFLRKAIGAEPIPPPVPLSDAEWQCIRALVRDLREARRESTDTFRVDSVAAALLGDPGHTAKLQRRRAQLHDAKLRRVQCLIGASAHDPLTLIRASRSWIAEENRKLTRAAFKDVGVPALNCLMTASQKPLGLATAAGTFFGIAAFVALAGFQQRPDFVICLGTGAPLGAAFAVALAVGRFSCAVGEATAAGEPPLVRAGFALLLADLFSYGATTFSLGSFGVQYDAKWAWGPLVVVALVSLGLIGVEAVRRVPS